MYKNGGADIAMDGGTVTISALPCKSKAGKQASKQSFRKQDKNKPVPLLLTILRRGRQAAGERVSKQEHCKKSKKQSGATT
jgi:hypothetical protein